MNFNIENIGDVLSLSKTKLETLRNTLTVELNHIHDQGRLTDDEMEYIDDLISEINTASIEKGLDPFSLPKNFYTNQGVLNRNNKQDFDSYNDLINEYISSN